MNIGRPSDVNTKTQLQLDYRYLADGEGSADLRAKRHRAAMRRQIEGEIQTLEKHAKSINAKLERCRKVLQDPALW